MARTRKKKPQPKAGKKKMAKKRIAPPRALGLSAIELSRAKRTYREFANAAWSRATVSGTLTHTFATMRQGAPGGGPLIMAFARRREGEGCAEVAEIAGVYRNPLAPGQACIGQAAVLQILNTAAAAECAAKVKCKPECPCEYVPRQALAAYSCANGQEEGYLLQKIQTWNCRCKISA